MKSSKHLSYLKKRLFIITIAITALLTAVSCDSKQEQYHTAKDILGNANYPAIAYGGYRNVERSQAPSVDEIKEDVLLLHAAGFRVLRTYHARLYEHTPRLLEAISELKSENADFEMYVMLGTWMQCENAFSDGVDHSNGDTQNNKAEIEQAVELINQYPDIVKIIAVGNESMVHWATGYFVAPAVILKWVNHLQRLKSSGEIPAETWITSSDNFASWGGESVGYHTEDLTALIKAVDYISMHTYPFHDTHYNSAFWLVPVEEEGLSTKEQADAAMQRAVTRAKTQYEAVASYVASIGVTKPIHIGETGWASMANDLVGPQGSKAADEYKQKLYYDQMREWSVNTGVSLFFFEAFDEPWKDGKNPNGSENHFGLFTVDGKAKYVMWDLVDEGKFERLSRGGNSIVKSVGGDEEAVLKTVLSPPLKSEAKVKEIPNFNEERKAGNRITENKYVVLQHETELGENETFPSATIKLNAWEGTCAIELLQAENVIEVTTGTGSWWGCALELQANGIGEDLSGFSNGYLHFEMKGLTSSSFQVGFQTGNFAQGTQVNNGVLFGPNQKSSISENWQEFSILISDLNKGANLRDVTALFFFLGDSNFDGKTIQVRDIYFTKK